MLMKRFFMAVVIWGFIFQGASYAMSPPGALSYPVMKPVAPPSPGQAMKVTNLLIIADISRSMADYGKVQTEQAFLASFNDGIPEDLKNAGMRTFGKSAYYHTVLVQPVQQYNRSATGSLIDNLKAGSGNTPLASALAKALIDLEETSGNMAILLVSDGENISWDPIVPAVALSEMYGERLCIHTVHVGESDKGRNILQEVAQQSECGIAKTADELQSAGSLKGFIANVFYSHEFVDSDGDGVADSLDKCPDTPRGVNVDKNGCPLDSDGDGVLDSKDKCPGTPKGVNVDANGCPLDTDGDGVADYMDKCPDTPKGVTVNSVGCWVIRDLKFDYNKWDIKPEYYAPLNRGLEVLEMNPTMKIEVQGHTDGKGSEQYNLDLSQKRADAVRDYLISKGISPDSLTAKGMGESNPIASNDTPEGRAENRRVEFKPISY